jgi:hypothetical protein
LCSIFELALNQFGNLLSSSLLCLYLSCKAMTGHDVRTHALFSSSLDDCVLLLLSNLQSSLGVAIALRWKENNVVFSSVFALMQVAWLNYWEMSSRQSLLGIATLLTQSHTCCEILSYFSILLLLLLMCALIISL